MRIDESPIEYYEHRVLYHIGNNIGKIVKVDKNTVMQERASMLVFV